MADQAWLDQTSLLVVWEAPPSGTAYLDQTSLLVVWEAPPVGNAYLDQTSLLVVWEAPPPGNAYLDQTSCLVVWEAPPSGTTYLDQTSCLVVWEAGVPLAVVPDISGAPTVLATFDGSGSQYPLYYAWEWTSVPGGSAIANYPIALPDNGATSLMVDNKLLLHFEGNADDTSGNTNNGTVSGATQVAGKVGSFAYSFDGVTDVITVSNNADFARGAGVSFTMVGWVKADAPIGHWEGICYHSSAGNSQGHLGIDPSGNLSGGTGDGATWAAVGSSHAVTAGTWMHVAMVVDRSANTLVLYADGVNVASSAWTAVPGTTTDDLTVGRGYGTGESFDGTIDEFAIWRRALSSTEIGDIYDQQSKTGLGSSTATAAFTPDVAGTYTVQLTVADGVSVTADAVIGTSGPENIDSIFGISKDNIGTIMGIIYGDIDKINDID